MHESAAPYPAEARLILTVLGWKWDFQTKKAELWSQTCAEGWLGSLADEEGKKSFISKHCPSGKDLFMEIYHYLIFYSFSGAPQLFLNKYTIIM